MKITFIGAGNMGGAIIRGLIRSGLPADSITIFNRSGLGLEQFAQQGCIINHFTEPADFVILAVKPWQLGELGDVARMGRCLVSIAAGVDIVDLEMLFETKSIVRVMPNTAVESLEGLSFITGHETYVESVANLFARLGAGFVVEQEKFDACMALGSCGLAYALRYARASMSGAVELGLKPHLAQQIVAQTLRGAASILDNGNHPETEIDKITTPGGITIKGLNAMERAGFTNAVIEGLKNSK